MDAPPYPFAYGHRDEFFALPMEERPPHIWECLQYLEWRRGVGDVSEAEIDSQVEIMRHIAQDVARHIAAELTEKQAWRDPYDPRWPRYHPESKDPLYLTGCHPPLLLCLHDSDEEWKEVEFDDSQREMADWLLTPAGLYAIPDEEREQTLRDAEVYQAAVEADRKAAAEIKRLRAVLDAKREELRRIDARIAAKLGRSGPKPPKPRLPD